MREMLFVCFGFVWQVGDAVAAGLRKSKEEIASMGRPMECMHCEWVRAIGSFYEISPRGMGTQK